MLFNKGGSEKNKNHGNPFNQGNHGLKHLYHKVITPQSSPLQTPTPRAQ